MTNFRKKRWRDKPENREKVAQSCRNYKLKATYGITVHDYEVMLTAQGNKCAICGSRSSNNRRSSKGYLCVDHDHNTGKVRGLLCHLCNAALGGFRDNPLLLSKAITYLEDRM